MKRNVFIISSVIILLDQVIKFIVKIFLLSEVVLLPNFFSLYKVYNTGAAFSLFSGSTYFLIVMNLIIFVFLYKYMEKFKVNKKNIIAFGLVFGGLVGNLIDRIYLGAVVDYLKFNFGNYTFPIFNLADMALCIGIVLIIIAAVRKEDVV